MLEKTYSPKDVEAKHYQTWEDSGAFQPKDNGEPDQKSYSIMMPPPNVTGSLHMGHALTYTLQDILVRYHRMRGYKTLWQPGTDHAGIATQMMVEKHLAKTGQPSRDELGRPAFLEKVWEWKHEHGNAIVEQQRRLGLTPDWSRQCFTMDDGLSTAVRKLFVDLYNDGLIYRKKRLVNWDPKLLTAVSDLEVDSIDKQGNMWSIDYDIEGGEGTITVATTRPETLFGDTGIAVHPEDERYKHLIGKNALVPFLNRPIPIVADEHSDPEKGTGAVKITPAHDFNDFEVGVRHDLEQITILDETAHLLVDHVSSQFAGLDRFDARKRVVAALEDMGKLSNVEQTTHAVPHGERSGVVLEPRLTDQWFVNTEPLAKAALDAVQKGDTTIMPQSGYNTYKHWMTNIQPWCISRQLWWGHQIPAWFGDDGTFFVAENEELALEQAKAHYGKDVELTQDPDVLDTWFSSALWPFSTQGWPEQTQALNDFYPTSCLVTGEDIIFFWVARMMMAGLYSMKDVPFKDVYLHALVLDAKGQKMSKTKGNVINPIDVMNEYGTDALRFTIAINAAPGRNIKYADHLVETNRNFATKLWNAARFLETNDVKYPEAFDPSSVTSGLNKWVISELVDALEKMESALDGYRFDDMAGALYHFTWGSFCDWFIELSKPILQGEDGPQKQETRDTLGWVLGQILHAMNPIMPFVTEELWSHLNPQGELLIQSEWPLMNQNKAGFKFETSQVQFNGLIDLISTIRSTRNDVNVPAGAKVPVTAVCEDAGLKAVVSENKALIEKLARVSELAVVDQAPDGQGIIQGIMKGASVFVSVADVIDITAERARLQKNLQKTEKEITILEKKLSNKKFVDNAPEDIITTNKERLSEELKIKDKINNALSRLV